MPELCEACGGVMTDWNIGGNCVLSRCGECFHVIRDIGRCNARARTHAWGGSGLFDHVRSWLTMRRLKRLLPRGRPLSILEIGFGSGKMLTRFLKAGNTVSGADPDMLDVDVDEQLKQAGTLYFDAFENVDLPAGEFDLIYGIHVIEHVRNPAAVFSKCFDALRSDGTVYFLTPNAGSSGLALFGEAWWNLEDPTHIRFFSSLSVEKMLHAAGFESVTTGIPVWDSLTLEINSLLRYCSTSGKKHGVLENSITKFIDVLLLPAAVTVRLICPDISPTLEITARKTLR